MLHLKSRRWRFHIPSGGMLIECDLFAGSRPVMRLIDIVLAVCAYRQVSCWLRFYERDVLGSRFGRS